MTDVNQATQLWIVFTLRKAEDEKMLDFPTKWWFRRVSVEITVCAPDNYRLCES